MSELTKGLNIDKRYTIKKLIGRGSFGEVWLAHDTTEDEDVALKFYISLDPEGIKEFRSEFLATSGLTHPNLLTAKAFSLWNNRPYLVMKYCSSGSTSALAGMVDEDTLWRFVRDVAAGLSYMHSRSEPVIHQDIKPDNILVDDDGRFLISDFGISRRVQRTLDNILPTPSIVGAVAYMGPERFGETPDLVKASDIWSFGASIYELAAGRLPFNGMGGGMQRGGAELPHLNSPWSKEINALICRCLALNPWDRPTAADILAYADARIKGLDVLPPWVIKAQDTPQRPGTTPAPEPEHKSGISFEKKPKGISIEKKAAPDADTQLPMPAPQPAPAPLPRETSPQPLAPMQPEIPAIPAPATRKSFDLSKDAPKPAPIPVDPPVEPDTPSEIKGYSAGNRPRRKAGLMKYILTGLGVVLLGLLIYTLLPDSPAEGTKTAPKTPEIAQTSGKDANSVTDKVIETDEQAPQNAEEEGNIVETPQQQEAEAERPEQAPRNAKPRPAYSDPAPTDNKTYGPALPLDPTHAATETPPGYRPTKNGNQSIPAKPMPGQSAAAAAPRRTAAASNRRTNTTSTLQTNSSLSFEQARDMRDYNALKIHADKGNAEACALVAENFLRQGKYSEAEKYAKLAQDGGSAKGRQVIDVLTAAGYYD